MNEIDAMVSDIGLPGMKLIATLPPYKKASHQAHHTSQRPTLHCHFSSHRRTQIFGIGIRKA